MDRYELVDGQSSKFWEAGVSGAELSVRFGRIGTAGQTKTKSFADAASAQREYEKLVREKTGKGYAPAGVAAPVRPSSPASAAAPVPRAPPAAAVTVTPPAPPATTPDPTQPFPVPTGGLDWRPSWMARLPPLRGLHAPAPQPPGDLQPEQAAQLGNAPQGESRMAERMRHSGGTWTFWRREDAMAAVTPERLARKDHEEWLRMVVQADCHSWGEAPVWPMASCVARHGTAFAFGVALPAWELADKAGYGWGFQRLAAPLRQAIAACGSSEHDQVLALAEQARTGSTSRAVFCAHIFAHQAAWAEESAGQAAQGQHLALLWTCALPASTFLDLLRKHGGALHQDEVRDGLLLQLRLHGDAAFDAFALLHERAAGAKSYDEAVGRAKELLGAVRTPAMLPFLAQRLQDRPSQDALDRLARDFPAAALHAVIEHAARARDDRALSWALRRAQGDGAALAAALAASSPAARAAFEAARAAFDRPEAPAENLPAVLREPPWLAPGGRAELPVLAVATIATPERLVLDPTQQHLAARAPDTWQGKYTDAHGVPNCFGLTPEGARAILAGAELPENGIRPYHGRDAWLATLFALPHQARLPFWNSYPARHWSRWPDDASIWRVITQHGFEAMPGVLAYFRANPDHAARLAPNFDSPRLVDLQLQSMQRGKYRAAAARWVRENARTVLCHALPVAFGAAASAERDRARQAIRWLAGQSCGAAVEEAADAYGATMATAVRQLLALDPVSLLPAEIPKRPKWLAPGSLRQPMLVTGGALPAATLEHLATMIAISALDAPYAGLTAVREHCTPASLAEFAWDLCEAWLLAGAPAKDGLALQSLGLLGDDGTARRLVPRIREWAEHGAPSRAAAALDLLAAIGSDVALHHLNAFTRQNKFKPLQKRAAALITQVAEARGLDEDELGDRLAPTLGLDEEGALTLDFGPRQFRLRFDETLHPYLQDAEGLRLKAIPRPNKNDNAELARQAIERYKAVRKEAEGIASVQVARLEQAMVQGRRWRAAAFGQFFLEHPLVRHLAARLVWGVHEGDTLTGAFRIAEDGTLADAQDALFTLPPDAIVSLPHTLVLGKAMQAAFGQVFADYEIAQPFRQLGRETFALTASEQALHTLERFAERRVATAGLLALNHRGWRAVDIGEGSIHSYERVLGPELRAELHFGPGYAREEPKAEPVQALGKLELRLRDDMGRAVRVPYTRLDAVLASELLRDVELLIPARH